MKKKFYNIILKVLITVPLLLFGLWLIQSVYFPKRDVVQKADAKKKAEEETIFRKILKPQDDIGHGHFHMIDEYVTLSYSYKPICLTCHGTYPHSKEQKVRSILNFHTGFMACSVCHVRKDPNNKNYYFVWVDRTTGLISMSVDGEFGKYPAEIFPLIVDEDGERKIFRPVNEKAAQDYLELMPLYTPDQNAQAKIVLHEKLTKKPVFCTDCHKKNGYLDFSLLGFPINRINHLTSTEIAGMITKYETFYLPTVIDFGEKK